MRIIENICLLLGRLLMGVYFILPDLMKISNYQGTFDFPYFHPLGIINRSESSILYILITSSNVIVTSDNWLADLPISWARCIFLFDIVSISFTFWLTSCATILCSSYLNLLPFEPRYPADIPRSFCSSCTKEAALSVKDSKLAPFEESLTSWALLAKLISTIILHNKYQNNFYFNTIYFFDAFY